VHFLNSRSIPVCLHYYKQKNQALHNSRLSAGGAGNVTVLLLINSDTPAGDLVATIDELRAVGVQSFEVVSDENDRK
jgi:hypothetical protein